MARPQIVLNRSTLTSSPPPPPLLLLLLLAVVPLGCAKATVTQTKMGPADLPKPDMVIVHDFATTPDQVKLDQGLAKTLARPSGASAQTEEEVKVAFLVADALSKSLVKELNDAGIKAYRAGAGPTPSATTMEVRGSFVRIDQGDSTKRNLIGLGLGNGKVETLAQAYQNGVLEAQALTSTRGSLMPGMLPSAGAGAAMGTLTGASVMINGVSTVVSNELMQTVEADAKRTAKELAERIEKAYRARGWLASK